MPLLKLSDSPVLPLPILGPEGGQELQNVALISDDHRANFFLKSVQGQDGAEIGVTNGQEWRQSPCPSDPQKNKRQYRVTVGFTVRKHGTYRQDLVFGFLNCPVYLQRICADYLHTKDYERIQRATNYQQSQIPLRWEKPYEFYSPFIPHANQREIKLSRVYPYPDRQNFILTQNTLSDNRLTPQNYRGRMHEMITLEEIARHEQLSRYNQVTWLRLMADYMLFNSDGSTIAKYTPPGELFAQVRFFLASRRFSSYRVSLFIHRARTDFVSSLYSLPQSSCERMYYILFRISRVCLLLSLPSSRPVTFTSHFRYRITSFLYLPRLYPTREIYCHRRSHSNGTSWRIRRAADSCSAAVIAFYSSCGARKQSMTSSSKLTSKIRALILYISD